MQRGHRLSLFVLAAVLATGQAVARPAAVPDPDEIVRRSIENNDRNWEVAPQYTYREKDVILKKSKKTVRCYQDLMIDGWPYQKLVAENGKPLSANQAKVEEQKLRQEIAHRHHESPAEKAAQIQKYRRARRQDHELMQQMITAFTFKLIRQQTVDGRRCYVLDGTPRPDYRPINRDTQVLKGMRGRLWVDTEHYQWVKVHAEVFRPVAFGLFIARVQPGTEFTLEQGPVGGGIWLPTRFQQDVKATVMFFWSHNFSDQEAYWGYRRTGGLQAARG